MAIFKKYQNNKNDYEYIEYVLDTAADVDDLPTDDAPGSNAMVVETGQIFMLNNQRQWIEI